MLALPDISRVPDAESKEAVKLLSLELAVRTSLVPSVGGSILTRMEPSMKSSGSSMTAAVGAIPTASPASTNTVV